MSEKTQDVKSEVVLSKEEQALIESKRNEVKHLNNFMCKLNSLCEIYGVTLAIDKNSPIGNPAIMPVIADNETASKKLESDTVGSES